MKIIIGIFIGILLAGIALTQVPVFGAPQEFIATPATSTPREKFSFTIGTTTAQGLFGTSTLAIYGSTTIQTWKNTRYAFDVLNAASSSVFRVDTINSSSTIAGILNVGSNGNNGNATSTFNGGVYLTKGGLRLHEDMCAGLTNGGALVTDANGNITCEADDGGGGGGATTYDAWTHPLAGQSATTSLMLFNGGATTTGLTVSAYLVSASSTIASTTVGTLNATSSLTSQGDITAYSGFSINGERFTDLTGNGLSVTGNALTCVTASGSVFGCLASADWTTFNNKVATTRTLTAGAGMTGGGDLSADRTFDVIAGDTTLTVNANDLVVNQAFAFALTGTVTLTRATSTVFHVSQAFTAASSTLATTTIGTLSATSSIRIATSTQNAMKCAFCLNGNSYQVGNATTTGVLAVNGSSAGTSTLFITSSNAATYGAIVLQGRDNAGNKFCREITLSSTNTQIFNSREVTC